MASLYYQEEAAALYYAVFGKNATTKTYESIGRDLELKDSTVQSGIASLLKSTEGKAIFSGKSNEQIITKIYTNVHGKAPSKSVIDDLIAYKPNSVASVAEKIINDLKFYEGGDSSLISERKMFLEHIDSSLYPATSLAAKGGASDVQAFYYVLGSTQVAEGINWWGSLLANGSKTREEVAKNFVNIKQSEYHFNNEQFVELVYKNAYLREPSSAEKSYFLEKLNSGKMHKEDVLISIVDDLHSKNITKNDLAAQTQFINATKVYHEGELPSLKELEKVASLYLAVPKRDVDAQGLEAWSKELAYGVTYKNLAGRLINSPEFQNKGASLTGDAFIQHVYTAVHGVKASEKQLAHYRTYHNDKADIVLSIINDLRNDKSTDKVTITQQHTFENNIGISLLYEKSDILNNSFLSSNGNATGTVNTGVAHTLSNAETAVLEFARLFLTTNNDVNLKFADHLSNLEILGTSIASVKLSDNNVNKGVNITVKNGNVDLDASSGNDNVIVDKIANIATGKAKFKLGDGNDKLTWGGNAQKNIANDGNKVGGDISADGGSGINTLSANFITKSFNTIDPGVFKSNETTFESNVNNFRNFQKIDLGGYIGKANGTFKGQIVNTPDKTFDFGLLNGTATTEGAKLGNLGNVTQVKNQFQLGQLGWVLSSKADDVSVINVAAGSSSQLEVTGNATAQSRVNFSFHDKLATEFLVKFTGNGHQNIDAGTLAFNNAPGLKTLNISSGGSVGHGNSVVVTGDNSVKTINIDGDNYLNFKVAGTDMKSVREIDATKNEAGVHISSDVSGSGSSWVYYGLSYIPIFGSLKELAHNGDDLLIRGTTGNDIFTVKDATTVIGNGGQDTFVITSSSSNLDARKSVVIADYSVNDDKVIDLKSNILVSKSTSGDKIFDYGDHKVSGAAKAWEVLKGFLGPIGQIFNAFGKLGDAIGLNGDKLESKVGISSVDQKHFLVIDNNDNGKLDASDQVIVLQGHDSHAQLINALTYTHDTHVQINGVHSELVA